MKMFMKSKKDTCVNLAEERNAVKRCNPEYQVGLDVAQVQERKEADWTNQSVKSSLKSTKDIIIDNTFTYFNLVFFILGLLLCFVQSYNNLTFLPVIIANTLIGIVQEVRAKNVLEKMRILNAPHTTAVRDGQEALVNSDELVIDDVVIFSAGNQICADAVVLNGEIQVNESLLTGESVEIVKRTGDHILSGSFVVSGRCHAQLDMIGCDSFISKLTLEAKNMSNGEQSEMIRSLNKLIKWVGIAIIPIGIMLFVQSYFINQASIHDSIVSMEAAVIGMIPEGLYLLTTLALAVSTMRLAKRRVLLHSMKSIETLARVNMLCVDKTGTITENNMTVQDLVETAEYKENSQDYKPLSLMLGDFCAAMPADNITMEALKKHFTEHSDNKSVSMTTFSSVVKYSSVTFEDGAYVLGAPEMVLRDAYADHEERLRQYSHKGYRILIFGLHHGTIDGKALTEEVTPLGYILLANPVRKEAKEAFQYFADQGVTIKVISGDNPISVAEAADKAGIEGAANYVDASTLSDHESMVRALQTYTVFGRVTPEQKKAFVEILKSLGNTVAMTGDGVNDILAMKEADCSIAMASGSDAAVRAAQVVLLDSDFSCMPSVVLEGRRVVNNIQRSASLFFVKNIFSLVMALSAVICAFTYPLKPSQITFASTFTIGIPSFFLALEPNESRIKGRFLPNVLLKALPGGLTSIFIVGAFVLGGNVFAISNDDISTAATVLMTIVGFLFLYKLEVPINRYRVLVIAANITGLLVCGTYFKTFFSLTDLSTGYIILFLLFAFAAESLIRGLSLFFTTISALFRKFKS